MGSYCHHGIIVTGYDTGTTLGAWMRAKVVFGDFVSPLVASEVNGFQSFFIPPDGSKEGWRRSDVGDIKRAEYIAWLIKNHPALKWIEVAYGNELGEDAIIDTSNHTRRKDHDET